MNASATIDRLTGLLAGPLLELGLDVEAVDLSTAGRRKVLRVAVDKDGGVEMDDIAAATRMVSDLLDRSDAMGEQAYTLEVSSPGVDRPLTLPRHWRRNIGRLVKVTGPEGSVVQGRITDATETSATLAVEGAVDGADVEVVFDEVRKALIQIEFKREG